jgi:hypothetical protein
MTRLEKLALDFTNVAQDRLDDAPRLWVGRAGALLAVDFYGYSGFFR